MMQELLTEVVQVVSCISLVSAMFCNGILAFLAHCMLRKKRTYYGITKELKIEKLKNGGRI
ncbi:MAG: hypothetical protein ACOX3W_00260 [Christensenellaceae bacterium]|jgi:hypothetical protein